MKIIDNIVMIDLKNIDNEYLIMNSLNSLVDVVKEKEYSIISKWLDEKNIIACNQHEEELLKRLIERQYVMDEKDEAVKKEHVINILLNHQEKIINNCKNASFIFSYKCNFCCPYCFEKNLHQDSELMTKDMIDNVFALYPNGVEYITLFGGEPLLLENKHLIQYVVSKAPNATYSIITNGYNLKEFIEIFTKINIGSIQVTLDGDKQMHNKTRTHKDGSLTYDTIINGIDCCLKNNIPIRIRMNVTYDNYQACFDERKRLSDTYKGNKFLSIELQELFQYKNEKKFELSKKITDNEAENPDFKNEIFKTMTGLTAFFSHGKPLVPCINLCQVEKAFRYYDNNGDIYSCTLSVGNVNKAVGKYYPAYELKERSILTRNITKIKQCSKCRLALYCGGGCPNGAVDSNGDPFNPNCNSIMHTINYIIPNIYNTKYKKKFKT